MKRFKDIGAGVLGVTTICSGGGGPRRNKDWTPEESQDHRLNSAMPVTMKQQRMKHQGCERFLPNIAEFFGRGKKYSWGFKGDVSRAKTFFGFQNSYG